MTATLDYGYKRGLPESVETAWGARMIAHATYLDLVPDRQAADGPRKAELLAVLNERVPRPVFDEQAYKVRGDRDDEILFYEDDDIIVKGSAQSSYGYCYIVAYFKSDA